MGADGSGVSIAVANNVAVPNGVVMVSPSATTPALSTIDDKGYFFRTAPSDARQGEVLAQVAKARGIKEIAVTYTNNDYGKGLTNSFSNAFKAAGGKVVLAVAHEDGKADYSAEVGALVASGAEHLAVFGYIDKGGKGIIQASLDAGAFDKFILADGMVGESLVKSIGKALNGSIATAPGSNSPNATKFKDAAKKAGLNGDSRSPSEPPRRPCSRSIAAAAGSPGPAALRNSASTLASFALSSSSLIIVNSQTARPDRTPDNTSEPALRCRCWNWYPLEHFPIIQGRIQQQRSSFCTGSGCRCLRPGRWPRRVG